MPAPWLFYGCAVSLNKKTPERAQRVRNSHKRSLIGLGWGCLCWALCLPKTMQLPNLAQGPLGKHQSKQKCCHSLHLSLLFSSLLFWILIFSKNLNEEDLICTLTYVTQSYQSRQPLSISLLHIRNSAPSKAHTRVRCRLGHSAKSIKAAIVLFPLTPLP